MDHLYKLIAALVVLCAACIPLDAAAFGAVTGAGGACYLYQGPSNGPNGATICVTTTEPLFQFALDQRNLVNGSPYDQVDAHGLTSGGLGSAVTFYLHDANQGYQSVVAAYRGMGTAGGGCPVNSEGTAPQCVCSKGYSASSDQKSCQPVQCPSAGDRLTFATVGTLQNSRGGSGSICVQGCEVQPSFFAGGADGRYWASGPYVAVGPNARCEDYAPSDPRAADPTGPNADTGTAPRDGNTGPPSPCAKGTYPGTVNGASVCAAPVSSIATGPTVAASGADSSNLPPIAGAPAGTASSTSTTACTGGSCTTTNNFYNAGGALIGTSSTTKPGAVGTGSPDGAASGASSSFGGSCEATTCSGDAVQCAIAQDQIKRNCQTLDAAPADDPAVVAAGAGLVPAGHPGGAGTTIDMSNGFDQTNLIAAACPPDMSVPVSHFGSVSIPFSTLCTPATWLGNILVGLTALTCIGIVFVRGR